MGSLAVVVIDVLPKNQTQVALAEDEQPVQGLVAQGLDHPLAMCVGFRASERRKGHLGTLGAEHVIELVDELGIAIVDGELDWSLKLVQLPGQVPCLLSDPGGRLAANLRRADGPIAAVVPSPR